MISTLRRYQQPMMIVLTAIICVAFAWFFTPGRNAQHAGFGYQIYKKRYSQEELDRKGREYSIAMQSGLGEYLFGLTGTPYPSQQAAELYILNSIVFEHEAAQLGLTVGDDAVVAAITAMPVFQGENGKYDPESYGAFIQSVRSYGFTEERFTELVRQQLILQKALALIGSGVAVTPAEALADWKRSTQKIDAAVLRWKLDDFKAAINPGDADIEKVFNSRAASYTTGEKRVVGYVRIELTADQQKLEGPALLEARQALSNRTADFMQELSKPGAKFADVAKKYGLEIKTAPEFAQTTPPAELAAIPQAAQAAFAMAAEAVSDPLPIGAAGTVGNGYAVLQLQKIIPSRPLTLAEARPQVVEQIKAEAGLSALTAKAGEARGKIEAALKAGKSLDDAAKEAGVTVETIPAFSPSEPPARTLADARDIVQEAVRLADGALSPLVQTPNGGLLVYVAKREPVNEADFETVAARQTENALKQKRYLAFFDWLQAARKAANPHSLAPQRVQEVPAPQGQL